PAVTTFKGTEFALWRASDNGLDRVSSTDGVNWSPKKRILDGTSVGARPALGVNGDRLYAVWKNAGDNGISSSSTVDGTTWTAPVPVAGASVAAAPAGGTTTAPAVTALGGKLFV